jgi:hypothetical protein
MNNQMNFDVQITQITSADQPPKMGHTATFQPLPLSTNFLQTIGYSFRHFLHEAASYEQIPCTIRAIISEPWWVQPVVCQLLKGPLALQGLACFEYLSTESLGGSRARLNRFITLEFVPSAKSIPVHPSSRFSLGRRKH